MFYRLRFIHLKRPSLTNASRYYGCQQQLCFPGPTVAYRSYALLDHLCTPTQVELQYNELINLLRLRYLPVVGVRRVDELTEVWQLIESIKFYVESVLGKGIELIKNRRVECK